MTSTRSGIDHEAIDHEVRPQDDLYLHANGRWLATHEIPDDRAMDGGFRRLHDEAEEQVRAIIEELGAAQADGSAPAEPHAARIGALYASFMDTETVERLGLAPIAEELAAVDAATTPAERVAVLGALQRTGGAGGVELYVDNDAKDPETYVVHLVQDGIGLPDEAYYREDQYAAIREAYLAHLGRMLALSGLEGAADAARRVLDLETRIAAAHWDVVKDRDAELTYNPMGLDELAQAAPGFDWAAWVAALGAPEGALDRVVVREPDALVGFAALWQEADPADWTAWLRYHLITARAPYLHDEVVQANFDFYGRTLSGTPAVRERWKRGVSVVQGALGEAVGQEYVARHFPATHKARMLTLVQHLLEAYGESISALDWMGADTRAKALDKLATFNPKIGYPDRWKSYEGLEIRADDLLGNVRRSHAYETDRELRKIGSPLDRGEWFMTPQTVNAYYNPGMNEIVFPAAILQPPFFDAEADDAVNYG
ncbi:M13 family metallopeptidase, partial [Actinotalea sp.]|uniref:M13 family metallopeptidase n=1 Tax=Actinotalea sp. TaxID=1872145 RepID=UPI00356A5840